MPLNLNLQPSEYAETFYAYTYDCDYYGCLKPGAALRYIQQIAGAHAAAAGLTKEVYAATHTAYVLAKSALHFCRPIRAEERLTLVTQPEALRRAVNKRVTVLLDEKGEEAAVSDGRWVLIDTEKRMILRKHPPEFALAPWATAQNDRELPMKMTRYAADACESMGTRYADYSFCDNNGHLNNTVYADFVCNALPWELLDRAWVQDLLIFYHKEVPRGESLHIYRRQLSEKVWYFLGQREGKPCFEATATLADR